MMDRESVLVEGAETLGADINEIWFAYVAAGENWTKLGDGADAQKMLNDRIRTIESSAASDFDPQEYINMQKARAKVSFAEVIKWVGSSAAYQGGGSNKVTKAYWTAREGTLSQVVNEGQPKALHVKIPQAGSGGNPTDVALRFGSGDILGVSLKSTGGSGNISFKAGGFDSTIKRLEAVGITPNWSAGDAVLGERDWLKVKEMSVRAASADLPMALYEAALSFRAELLEATKKKDPKERVKGSGMTATKAQPKAQSQKERKMFMQMLQYFGIPEKDRNAFLLKKYRDQGKATAKAAEFVERARYLKTLMPPEELEQHGGTFEGYARNWYETHKDTGNDVLGKARDIALDGFSQLDQPTRAAFVMKEYINATAVTPYWIKVTGMGEPPNVSAKVDDVNNNPRYAKLNNSDITFESVAGGTIGVKAGGDKIITIRFKWESAPLTTSIKTDVKNW